MHARLSPKDLLRAHIATRSQTVQRSMDFFKTKHPSWGLNVRSIGKMISSPVTPPIMSMPSSGV